MKLLLAIFSSLLFFACGGEELKPPPEATLPSEHNITTSEAVEHDEVASHDRERRPWQSPPNVCLQAKPKKPAAASSDCFHLTVEQQKE